VVGFVPIYSGVSCANANGNPNALALTTGQLDPHIKLGKFLDARCLSSACIHKRPDLVQPAKAETIFGEESVPRATQVDPLIPSGVQWRFVVAGLILLQHHELASEMECFFPLSNTWPDLVLSSRLIRA